MRIFGDGYKNFSLVFAVVFPAGIRYTKGKENCGETVCRIC